jgi:acyl-CoA synthetase (AMP-forming)/AMP-acid ligase II
MTRRPASIAEAFILNAERAPNKLCLRFEGEEWTYHRLRDRAETFAAALDTWGLRPGDRAALFLENRPDFLAAYLGAHVAGGAVVPVSTRYRKGELGHAFGDAGVPLCFTDGERRPELERVRGTLPDLEAVIKVGERMADFCRSGPANYKKPREVVFVEALPCNALGKVLKHKVLRELIEAEE